MNAFALTTEAIETAALRRALAHAGAGAVVCFEGTVRDTHEGRAVTSLDYEAYAVLAEREGAAIVAEALSRFAVTRALAVHRTGQLALGDTAVWIGVSAPHRGAAFDACRFLIDEIKARVPIWKHERYADGAAHWRHPE